MQIIGMAYGDEVRVANLSPDGDRLTVVAGVREFWADPETWLARPPTGPAESYVPFP